MKKTIDKGFNCLTFVLPLQYRAEYSVPSRTEKILKAIEECDFQVQL